MEEVPDAPSFFARPTGTICAKNTKGPNTVPSHILCSGSSKINCRRQLGQDNKEAARMALARIKLCDELSPVANPNSEDWTVGKDCKVYLEDLHQALP